jgi:hypothetical protein
MTLIKSPLKKSKYYLKKIAYHGGYKATPADSSPVQGDVGRLTTGSGATELGSFEGSVVHSGRDSTEPKEGG